jgi:hypothetical protein
MFHTIRDEWIVEEAPRMYFDTSFQLSKSLGESEHNKFEDYHDKMKGSCCQSCMQYVEFEDGFVLTNCCHELHHTYCITSEFKCRCNEMQCVQMSSYPVMLARTITVGENVDDQLYNAWDLSRTVQYCPIKANYRWTNAQENPNSALETINLDPNNAVTSEEGTSNLRTSVESSLESFTVKGIGGILFVPCQDLLVHAVTDGDNERKATITSFNGTRGAHLEYFDGSLCLNAVPYCLMKPSNVISPHFAISDAERIDNKGDKFVPFIDQKVIIVFQSSTSVGKIKAINYPDRYSAEVRLDSENKNRVVRYDVMITNISTDRSTRGQAHIPEEQQQQTASNAVPIPTQQQQTLTKAGDDASDAQNDESKIWRSTWKSFSQETRGIINKHH